MPDNLRDPQIIGHLTSEALKCLRAWAANWGLSYSVKTDSGPAFRQTWQDELEKVGVSVIHSSAYNPQSMGNPHRG